MRLGKLNRRVRIERYTETPDGRGGYATAWGELATVWAEVISQSGREAVIGRSLQGIASYRVTILWRPDAPTTADRLIYEGRELNIRTSDDPDGARERIVMLADTESPQGAA